MYFTKNNYQKYRKMTNQPNKSKTTLLVVGVLFIIWSILGFMDAKNFTDSGYNTDDNWTINKIEEGGPAEAAGLQVGDVIKSTGGIAVTDTKALSKRQRAKIGETRDFVVDRNGNEMTLQLTFAELPSKDKTNNMVGSIIGLLFIIIGLYANHKHKSSLGNAFAIFAICFGFIFASGPYFSSDIVGTIVGILGTAVVLFSFTALTSFMLRYPPESAFLSSKNSSKLLYGPMLLILAIIIILQLVRPDGSGTLNMIMRLLFGVFIIGNFLVAVVTLIRKYLNASASDRGDSGLNMMLIGTIIGIVPMLVYFTIGTISPGIELPGQDYVFFTFAAIPICFMIALNKISLQEA
jgi:hypothetical protein